MTLTQLTLGVDRDSALVAHDFDERDPGVLKMISMAIQGAKRNHRHIGLCGQAPSDYPEFAEFLVKEGINSMSLNPDSIMKITLKVIDLENKSKLLFLCGSHPCFNPLKFGRNRDFFLHSVLQYGIYLCFTISPKIGGTGPLPLEKGDEGGILPFVIPASEPESKT